MKHLRHILIAALLPLCIAAAAQDFSFPYRRYQAPEVRTDTITLRFIGDVMLHTRQIEVARQKDGSFDFSTFLEGIRPDLESADIAVANMEFTLGGAPYTGYPAFSAPDSYADYASDCGVDVFLTANNHILDRGNKGLRRTLSRYDEMEKEGRIVWTGCSMSGDTLRNPLLIPVRGALVAIVNFTYGTNCGGETADGPKVMRMNEDQVRAMLSRARRSGADIIVACPHWGTEYKLTHSGTQEKWAHLLADNGADVIIGAHPHVVQDFGTVTASDGRVVPVYYSLGNAVSNMSAPNTQKELMVTVRFTRTSLGHCSAPTVTHDWLWCSHPGTITKSFATVKLEN